MATVLLWEVFMPDCLFCNIVEGKVPSNKVFEDDRTYAFEDIRSEMKASTHTARRQTFRPLLNTNRSALK